MFYNQAFDSSYYPSFNENNYSQVNGPFVNPTITTMPNTFSRPKPSSTTSSSTGLFLPALIFFAFTWILQALATFLPYWSTYSTIADSRAGLWDARNFNSTSIQNFYFARTNQFPNITGSISFTSAYTKGYMVTVQFLMTFNFAVMFILLIFLTLDYIFSHDDPDDSRAFLNKPLNNYETGMRFGLLLYMIYVLGAFEFAAWITYIGSRHDNNWQMHVCFAFAVIVSAFLIGIFVMYVIEFIKRFRKSRSQWQYWYGPYAQWAFFIHLTALIFLLTTICCPEWAYQKEVTTMSFAEYGLFKQCLVSFLAQDTLFICVSAIAGSGWFGATQAFILMAYIFGTILWIVMVVFRRDFLHDHNGYVTDGDSQPKLTFIMAGLILFFCFIFSLIGVAIYGAYTFPSGPTVNWGYILTVLAMFLFLVVGILLILDGIHSDRQADINDDSFVSKVFPAPLNQRALLMEPLLKPKPVQPFETPFQPVMMPPEAIMTSWNSSGLTYPMAMPGNYIPQGNMGAPVAQAGLMNYVQQGIGNPQWASMMMYPTAQDTLRESQLSYQMRQHFLQQQRLNHNHERLLERYQHLTNPRPTEFRPFGTSVLPGRSYNDYLDTVSGAYGYDDAFASMMRNRVFASPSSTRKTPRKLKKNETNELLMETVLIYDSSSK